MHLFREDLCVREDLLAYLPVRTFSRSISSLSRPRWGSRWLLSLGMNGVPHRETVADEEVLILQEVLRGKRGPHQRGPQMQRVTVTRSVRNLNAACSGAASAASHSFSQVFCLQTTHGHASQSSCAASHPTQRQKSAKERR